MTINANSFTLLNSTPAKIAQLDAALRYLQMHSPEIAAPVLAVAAESQVRIVFSDPKVNPHDGYGEKAHTIVWDPNSALIVNDERGNEVGVQSAANGLFHEIVHAVDINQAVRESIPNVQYGNDAEAVAVIYADAVAKDCGEIQRNNYEGSELAVSNVTEHTGADGTGRQVWRQTNATGQEETGPRYKAGDPAPTFGSSGSEQGSDPAHNAGGGTGSGSGNGSVPGTGGRTGGAQGDDQAGSAASSGASDNDDPDHQPSNTSAGGDSPPNDQGAGKPGGNDSDPGSVGAGDNDDPDHQPSNPGADGGSGEDAGEDDDGQVGSGIDNGPGKDGSGPEGGRNRDVHDADLRAKPGGDYSVTLHGQAESTDLHGLIPGAPSFGGIGPAGSAEEIPYHMHPTSHEVAVIGVPPAAGGGLH